MTAHAREKTQTEPQVERLKKLADDEVGRPPQRTPEIHEKISGRSLGEPPVAASSTFSELSAHGNYEFGALPEGVVFVPADGSIRTIRKLGIPHVDVVEVVRAYGSHWFPRRIGYAIHAENEAQLRVAKKPKHAPKPHPDLLLCIREASRGAP